LPLPRFSWMTKIAPEAHEMLGGSCDDILDYNDKIICTYYVPWSKSSKHLLPWKEAL
jgi:hypothetical protein